MSVASEDVVIAGFAGLALDVEAAGARPARPRGLRLRDALLSTVAAGALSLAIGGPALAGPDACTPSGGGTVETCTGNQSAGIATTPPVTTLNVNNLTQAIAPASGTPGINFTSNGAITITSNTGAFGITTAGTGAYGIEAASTGGGAVTVTSTGNISTAGSNAHGIFAEGVGGAVTVTSTGNIVTAGLQAVGIYARSVGNGTVMVTSTGNITTAGNNASGIDAVSGGAVTVTSTGNIITTGGDAYGIVARSVGNGAVTVTSTGNISTAGNGAHGIFAENLGAGAVTVTSTGNITTAGNGAFGIFAESRGAGAFTVTSTGNITTAGSDAHGIVVANLGAGAVTVTSTGNITTAGTSADGIFAQSTGGGTLTVTSTGNITTTGGNAYGILALSTGASAVTVTSTGNITTAGNNGIFANSFGGGVVTVTSTGNIATAGSRVFGIYAVSGGGGAVTVTSTGNITTAGSDAHGIFAENLGAGAVTVTSTGNITTAGNSAFGIFAESLGAGAVTVNSTGNITTAGSYAFGIRAVSFGAGAVTVTSTGNITTAGNGAFGIFAESLGAGAVTVTSTGNITTARSYAFGIFAKSTGAVTVTSTGNITTAGSSAYGIFAGSNGSPIAVTINSGTVSGGSGSGAGVDLFNGTNNTLTNFGTVTALSGLAIEGDTGNNIVTNFGAVIGNVILGSGTNAFNNMAGGLFNAGPTVNLGAGNTLTNAGTLSPGGAGTIRTTALTGNLVQTATGRLFADINIAGATSDRVNVSGTANLAGAVQVQVQNPILGPWQQTVLSATGGTTNNGLSLLASPVLHAQLIFPNATDVAVQSSGINFLAPGLNGNQAALAGGLNGAAQIAGLGGPVFNALLNITSPAGYANALTQLDGEAATGAQGASFQLTNSFLALLTGPTGGPGNGGGPAMPFAPERADAFPSDAALAYASVLKAPMAYEPRWTSWGAAFGGGSTTRGDPAGAGTNNVSAHTGAFAAGVDYHVAPDTVVGVALAGGAVNWALGGGLGGGRGDTFLAGLYGSKQAGLAYLSGAATFSSNWMSTSRSIAVAGPDTLTASFNAQNFGGRLEGGYRVQTAMPFNVTPYAAVQAETFHSPGYSETGTLAAPDPFALAFNAQSATVVRTELGSRFDQTFAPADASTVDVFGRLAWAHDWQSNPNLTATFIGLPTATFVVNGAAPPTDRALVTAGAEWRWHTGWAFMAKFDGEFASRSQTYTGTAQIKYSW